MTFKIILEDGERIGNYSTKKSPAQVAKCAMRIIYQKTARNSADINFFNTDSEKEYTYRCDIEKLEKPEEIKIGGKRFLKHYNIFAKRI